MCNTLLKQDRAQGIYYSVISKWYDILKKQIAVMNVKDTEDIFVVRPTLNITWNSIYKILFI